MERQKIKRYIENYIDELENEIGHPILQRDTNQIELDVEKTFFLLLPLLNGEEWTNQMNKASIAVGAVHIAFNAHDTIDMSNATSRKQQLTVLAGDYYSGIHYRLLAMLPDFGFIRTLSSMIGRINEVKTTFHGQAPANSVQLLDAIQTIEAGCITEFLHAFGFSRYVPLAKAALPLLRIDTDLVGQSTVKQPIYDVLGWEKNDHDVEQVIKELRLKMYDAIDKADFLAPFLKEEIQGMAIPLLGKSI